MFDLSQIIELLRVEPGHGLVQSFLLFMIWLSARGMKKELADLKDALTTLKAGHEQRIVTVETKVSRHEERILHLEHSN